MIDIEELRADKIEQMKMDMYEEMANEKRMYSDSDYAFDCIMEDYAEEITKANELLQKVANEMEKYNIYVTPSEILKEI